MVLLLSQYFNTKPYACDPSTLPKYPPNKEMDAKYREELQRRYQSIDFHKLFIYICVSIYVITFAERLKYLFCRRRVSIQKRDNLAPKKTAKSRRTIKEPTNHSKLPTQQVLKKPSIVSFGFKPELTVKAPVRYWKFG